MNRTGVSGMACACRMPSRRDAGMALPAVVAVGAAIAALTGAWFESALTEARRTRALSDHLIAFHAADAALAVCVARLRQGGAPYIPAGASGAEPDAWRDRLAFAMPEAIEPFAQWPISARPPRCLIEAWRIGDRADDHAYLVTARGTGAHMSATAWLQMQVRIRDGVIVTRRWRRVASAHR